MRAKSITLTLTLITLSYYSRTLSHKSHYEDAGQEHSPGINPSHTTLTLTLDATLILILSYYSRVFLFGPTYY